MEPDLKTKNRREYNASTNDPKKSISVKKIKIKRNKFPI